MSGVRSAGFALCNGIQIRPFVTATSCRIKDMSNQREGIHLSAEQKYPAAEPDISATAIVSHQSTIRTQQIDVTLDNSSRDPHVDSYDCFGAVSLNSAIQSNVPSPFGGLHKFSHLNMPGGQWSQEGKFTSHDLQNSHYMNLRQQRLNYNKGYNKDTTGKGTSHLHLPLTWNRKVLLFNLHEHIKPYSTDANKTVEIKDKLNNDTKEEKNLSKREQLKKAVKEYGTTVIVFHIGISLISLECFYLLVSSGIDLIPLVESLGLGSTTLSNKVATGTSTFVVAYAIHKIFAPVRISITLGATPFIVKYLRKKGILKTK